MTPQESAAAPEVAVAEDPVKVQNARVLALLHHLFGEATFTDVEEQYGLLSVTTTREHIHGVIAGLQQDQEIKLNFLTTMCGINYPENEGKELGMIYHLHSLTQNIRLRLKIFFPVADPVVPTLTDLYNSANWMEREAYDLFGIVFTGHPDMTRILLPEDWEGHPLRKDYPMGGEEIEFSYNVRD